MWTSVSRGVVVVVVVVVVGRGGVSSGVHILYPTQGNVICRWDFSLMSYCIPRTGENPRSNL